MKRTLVLAVDRDDDYGVKARVSTPIIGIETCINAANALGVADPEDSDLNALYAAVSTCMELQEEGVDAEVALICGNEKVGHKADMTLSSELETVLDQVQPDNVILVGDGAEDEYIYPIISSRSQVVSVRKVYVKQASNIESSFYILTKMLSEPNKRRRFVAPVAAIIFIVAFFMLIPDLVVLFTDGDVSTLPAISRDMILLVVGALLLLYAYNFSDKWVSFSDFAKERILARSTRLVMTMLSFGIVLIGAIVCYYQLLDTYQPSLVASIVYYISMMVWPFCIAMMVYLFGAMLDEAQDQSVFRMSNLFDCISIASLGMVLMGLFDIVLYYISPGYDGVIGIIEIIVGILLALSTSFIKSRLRPEALPE